MTDGFRAAERARAAAWKLRTPVLSVTARRPAPWIDQAGHSRGLHDHCLPAEHAADNLLPEAQGAIELFSSLGIPWHCGVADGPGNNLLSSQVQCVNALFPMIDDPERIRRAFGHVVDIAEVLPIEDGRYVTFEYIGPVDYFDEGLGKPRTRGSRCTSVDAAFRYRTHDGRTELALVEWKYTEQYRRKRAANPAYDLTRIARYGPDFHDPSGPLRSDVLPIELMLDEPFYQLMRQQLLAHRLEVDRAEGADTVRVLHVSAPGNSAYQRSLVRPEHRELGATVDDVWRGLLRAEDRFVSLDSGSFVRSDLTSRDYSDRYGTVAVEPQWGVSVWRSDGRVVAAAFHDSEGFDWCHTAPFVDVPTSLQALAELPGREWLPLGHDEMTLLVGPTDYARALLTSLVCGGLRGVGEVTLSSWPTGSTEVTVAWPSIDLGLRLP